MIKEKRFYIQFFSMLIVLILQNVITLSVNLADNIMLGGYSEQALAGVAAVNQIQFIYQQLLMAAGEGIVILGAQYFGKNQIQPVRTIASIAMHFGIALGIGLFILVSLFPHALVQVFTTDEAIIVQGVSYLKVIRFTYLFFAMTQLLLAALRSTGTVEIALGLSLWALACNCTINYTLIYGHFGFPRMGAVGAAIGTLVSRITELLILIFYIARKEKILHLSPSMYMKTGRLLRKDY